MDGVGGEVEAEALRLERMRHGGGTRHGGSYVGRNQGSVRLARAAMVEAGCGLFRWRRLEAARWWPKAVPTAHGRIRVGSAGGR